MTMFIFGNMSETSITNDVLSTDTSITVNVGSEFPSPISGQLLALTITNSLNSSISEIVYCTQISGNTLTVVRGQENTIAQNWKRGDLIANLFTAGTANNFMQINFGTTSQRPIPSIIGQSYFDTTLGYQINCSQITPSVIWHNGAGQPV